MNKTLDKILFCLTFIYMILILPLTLYGAAVLANEYPKYLAHLPIVICIIHFLICLYLYASK